MKKTAKSVSDTIGATVHGAYSKVKNGVIDVATTVADLGGNVYNLGAKGIHKAQSTVSKAGSKLSKAAEDTPDVPKGGQGG